MNDQSPMSDPKTSGGSPSATSSAESQAGPTPCGSPGGPTTDLFGQAVVHAHHSRRRAKGSAARSAKAKCLCRILSERVSSCAAPVITNGSPTGGISGPSFAGSSRSAALQPYLASRLHRRMGGYGSPEYELRWKSWGMALGQAICALRASGRRTSGNGFGGWPTPDANAGRRFGQNPDRINPARTFTINDAARMAGWPTPTERDIKGRTGADSQNRQRSLGHARSILAESAALAGWPTPKAGEDKSSDVNLRGNLTLKGAARMAGWCTPTQRDHKGIDQNFHDGAVNNSLPNQAHGLTSISSTAGTGKRGALNPAHSRWLMGFPPEWDACGVTAMPSSRKSRRSS